MDGHVFVVAPAAGALADRIGERPLLAGGLLLQATGMAWLASIARPGLAYAAMLGPLIVAGVGCSAAIPVSQAAVVGAVDQELVGKAAGANNMLQELGGAVGVALTVAVFTAVGSNESAAGFADGFRPALATAAGVALVGVAAALILPARRPAVRSHP